jgi:diguanylate cyclase (GGDEF)-like protein
VEKNRELARLSMTDPLTGLRNRRYLDEVLRLELLRARRFGSPLCVLMVDVDRFKNVNDRYGHAAGDRVLCELAARLGEGLRETDALGRFGGEEFLLVLTGVDAEGGLVAAERWRARVEAAPVALGDGRSVSMSVSVGVASLAADMDGPAALLATADAALYEAKGRGRNCVVVADAKNARAASAASPANASGDSPASQLPGSALR